MFKWPHLNTKRVGRILDSYATRDVVEGLHNFQEFSQPPECLYEAM